MAKDKSRNSEPSTGKEANYFLSLSVQNVRGFGEEAQTLDLSDGHGRPRQWTIILGNNGTGKTTLLQLLAYFEDSVRNVGWVWSPTLLRTGKDAGKVEIRLVKANQGMDGNKQNGTGGNPFFWKCQINSSAIVCHKFSLICFGYGAGRRNSIHQLNTEITRDPVGNLFSDEIPLRNAEEWLLQLDYSASKKSPIIDTQKQRLKQVKDILINLLPDVDDIRFTQPTKKEPIPRAEFKTPYGWVFLSAMGYGYQTLIAWIVDLASRLVEQYPDSDDPLSEPAVVLVDEIDLHLHPSWQRDIMKYLSNRFPNTQFIATAHSPLIVQAAPSVNANVVVLRRPKGKDYVVIDNETESVRGWRVDQILASDLYDTPPRDASIQKLIDERRKILAKSKLTPSDKKKVKELEEQIGNLPVGESPEEIKTMELLKKTLDILGTNGDQP